MNCPHCGTELPNGMKYCSTCGADVETAAARQAAPTQQMPPAAPSHGAVPMRPQASPAQPGRSIDTRAMTSSPKWPYVLVALLVVIIVAIVLLIVFHPWTSTGTTTPTTDDTQVTATTPAVIGDGTTEGDTSVPGEVGADAVEPADTDEYAELSSYYGKASGYDASIAATATDFNNNYLASDQATRQSYAAQAASLYETVAAERDAVNALGIDSTSSYYGTYQQIATLYECLYQRVRVISEAWNVSASASDPNSDEVTSQISSILGADNDSTGTNKYKTQYNEVYASLQL